MPVEKVIPRFTDLVTLLPLLTSHATGQPLSNYVTMLSGPRRAGEDDGPEELHVVFLDNRRRALLGTRYEEMLACIRCGACLNVCPVYRNVSGHAYDAVYSGPMGRCSHPCFRPANKVQIFRTARRCVARAMTRARCRSHSPI
jgi:L-lactate dehydrogenase complex protein LldF